MRRLGGDLLFSTGINSGEVMATAVESIGDSTVIGDTVNVAARLKKVAGPGEVLCGPLTVELVGSRARFRARPAVVLKGKREPVDVWEAVSMEPADVGMAVDEVPLLGRDAEMAYLGQSVAAGMRRRASGDRPPFGDAGSGKTRLANELARLVTPEGLAVRAAYPAYGAMGGIRVAADALGQLGPSPRRGGHGQGAFPGRNPRRVVKGDRPGRSPRRTDVGAGPTVGGEELGPSGCHHPRRHASQRRELARTAR